MYALRRVLRERAGRPLGLSALRFMSSKGATVQYSLTDEAPLLATYSLLPIFQRFAGMCGIEVTTSDISLSGRVLAQFPDKLPEKRRVKDALADLGELAKRPEAVIIKTPNISASIPQLVACIAELRTQGYDVPLYPTEPSTPEEHEIQARYAKVLGSAVNPVLREGNSDRRVAPPVKAYAQANPHKMGSWSRASQTHVAHMSEGDFFGNEQSTVVPAATEVAIELVGADGTVSTMKEGLALEAGEVIDATFMSKNALCDFLEREIEDAKENDLLLSLHLKATMMKVSDPIMFGHAVRIFYKDAFEAHAERLAEIGANPNNGIKSVFETIEQKCAPAEALQMLKDFDKCYESRPWLAMVNSDKGITNLHVPSDVIIDASMPNVVRDSGGMWNKDDRLEDTKCVIPDRSYATAYQSMISYVKENGQFDVSTMGHVSNVGLMAKKAEEYGSHDKTFEVSQSGTMRVVDKQSGDTIFEHSVEEGDIWRMCQTKDVAIRDWVRLAVSRARATGAKAIFWLDSKRAHDATLIELVNRYLQDHDTSGLDIEILKPVDAMRASCERATAGEDTISVTGNVLRDYNTDLFPILELGTSAKMLSIVPLLAGGGLFETGAGGSAPKHVQQFQEEGHLRWDSLGEYLATAAAFQHIGATAEDATVREKATRLGDGLNKAVSRLLANKKSPSRKVNEIDNRASNSYLAIYWAEAMAEEDPDFAPLAEELQAARPQIVEELKDCQGTSVDIGGYYRPDPAKTFAAMNPSATFAAIIGAEPTIAGDGDAKAA